MATKHIQHQQGEHQPGSNQRGDKHAQHAKKLYTHMTGKPPERSPISNAGHIIEHAEGRDAWTGNASSGHHISKESAKDHYKGGPTRHPAVEPDDD